MSTARTPVDGPHPIHVYPAPCGATVDVSAYLRDVIFALVRDEAAALGEIAEWDELSPGMDSHIAHERDELVEQLIDRLAPRLPVYGAQVWALADRLRELAHPKPVPAQHNGGAAA